LLEIFLKSPINSFIVIPSSPYCSANRRIASPTQDQDVTSQVLAMQ
jgi:hypothetical protein